MARRCAARSRSARSRPARPRSTSATWPRWPPSACGRAPEATAGGCMSSATGPEKTPTGSVEQEVHSTSDVFDLPSFPGSSFPGARGLRLIERHARFYGRLWLVFASGPAEPLFYLLSVGIGIGGLIGTVQGPAGHPVPY